MEIFSIGCNRILSWTMKPSPQYSTSERWQRPPDSETILFEDSACMRSKDILCLVHSSEGERLASGSVDGAVRCWRTDGKTAAALPTTRPHRWLAHSDRVSGVAWEPSSNALLSAGYDGWLRCWRPSNSSTSRSYQLTSELRVEPKPGGRVLSIATSASTVLCGTSTGCLVFCALDAIGSLVVEANVSLPGNSVRVTSVVAVPKPGSREATFVAGDSNGILHVVSCSLKCKSL